MKTLPLVHDAHITKGMCILVRAGLNVPLQGATVAPHGTWRLTKACPTLRFLSKKGARVIVIAHLGRPNGKVVKKLSLAPVARKLSSVIGRKVYFIHSSLGYAVRPAIQKRKPGDIMLLENLRFYSGEEKNSMKFARELSGLAELYVNDAFGDSHRSHASTSGITRFLPSYAGFQLMEEVAVLTDLLQSPKMPFVVLIGGKKLSSKLGVIQGMVGRGASVLLGGHVANVILLRGEKSYRTLPSSEQGAVRSVVMLMRRTGKILLPNDVIIENGGRAKCIRTSQVTAKNSIIDIGKETRAVFLARCKRAGTIVWNGPLGVIEKRKGSGSSIFLARSIAALPAQTVIGGGETVELISRLRLMGKFSHISTGGGALLAFLAGEKLPGIEALIA